MSAGLILIVVVVAAYLAAHVVFDWLGRRYLIVSGAEYLLLGILLGPEVSGILNASVVGQFAPFMTLALGWIGALIGAQFHLPGVLRINVIFYRVAFLEAILSLAVTAGAIFWLLTWLFAAPRYDALVAAIALGTIATASAPSGIGLVARELGRRGPLVQQLEVATAIDALVAIVTFGILLSIVHAAPVATYRPPTATEWAVISVAIGVVGGALFHLFLGDERDPDRLFVALGGAVVLASGAAAYLELTPLLPTMIIGAVLVNTSDDPASIREVLTRVERPLYYVLLLFAGAAWSRADGTLWLVPVLAFLAVRIVAKLGSARIAARSQRTLDGLGRNWGLALLGHGGLAVAVAFNYHMFGDMPFREIVFTAALVSVLVTDFTSARVVRDVLTAYARRMRSAVGAGLAQPTVERAPPGAAEADREADATGATVARDDVDDGTGPRGGGG